MGIVFRNNVPNAFVLCNLSSCTYLARTCHSKSLETSYDSCVIYVAGKLSNQFKEKIEQENNFYVINLC